MQPMESLSFCLVERIRRLPRGTMALLALVAVSASCASDGSSARGPTSGASLAGGSGGPPVGTGAGANAGLAGSLGGSGSVGGSGSTGSSSSAGGPSGFDAAPCGTLCMAVTPSDPTRELWGGLGNVTEYSLSPSDGGACLFGTTTVRHYAAMSVNLQAGDGKGAWQGGRICGQCAEVTVMTSAGPRSTVVRIMDKCPDGSCGIDLGGDAPAAVMLDGFGRYSGQWKWVSCVGHPEVSDGPPVLFIKDGSSAYWSRIQVRNPPAGVVSIAYRTRGSTGSFTDLPFGEGGLENYYSVPVDLLGSHTDIELHIRFTDGTGTLFSTSTDTLTQAESSLTIPEAVPEPG